MGFRSGQPSQVGIAFVVLGICVPTILLFSYLGLGLLASFALGVLMLLVVVAIYLMSQPGQLMLARTPFGPGRVMGALGVMSSSAVFSSILCNSWHLAILQCQIMTFLSLVFAGVIAVVILGLWRP